ncbi:hypothetical protein [Streptomyces sp. NPDC046821]|uniref:hypothetical protein n=1 Tax=Streptomyces sp. NPDC046821 TaxID=3154702 RepID=UPI0033C28924
MSRETDSSSSGPQGRGGAAYPSGTPPYGTPAQGAGAGDGAPGPAGQPADGPAEERKTETTLTTRIRINIPGSRPIPPVVMRTPMSDVNGGPGDGTPAKAPAPAPERAAEPAPRTAPSGDARSTATAAPAAPAAPAAAEKTSDWFAPRKAGAPQRGGAAGAGNSGAVPGPSSGSGAFDVSGAVAAGPLGVTAQNRPPQPGDSGDPLRGDLPFFAGNPDGTGPGVPPAGPKGPTSGPAGGDSTVTRPMTPGTPGGLSDDTAILTPQTPAPEPGSDDPSAHVSGGTLTSGIPVVPPGLGGPNAPFGQGSNPETSGPHTPPKLPDPVGQSAPAPARKKGRSKLVLLGGGVVALAGVAYGAGLLMNHADVAKGTTVLGVDIGGGTRDEATAKLDNAFAKRTTEPLQLTVDGKNVTLKPDQAGLSLDSAATVAAAAGSDYNPVSVIGSLFGNERVVNPVMPVDEEKLQAALERAAGGATASSDGTIRFVPGKAVAVYGKTGEGVDVARSAQSVEEAYRTHVETGASLPVPLATATRTPTVSNAEVDRMMKEFAQPAMSANVIIKAGNAQIPFGPAKSLPQILSVKAVDGKLVEYYDRDALKKLYGNTFDGILITRATGKKTPVTPEDVIGVMRMALKGKTPAQRIGVIQTNPS